ncbi:hypothetical protein NZ698_18145 [Chryseobacterium sp. PBS4-4]|uniref:Histidine kinase N-terminal 7TM region domain-containing protein n=1 Tax=Chryseobacterium edaphi TaxID=2976532 RepID=A0ABT2WA95_9FLAO|nr:hypothetical protein [Chryseobacterium edaphi]MCU7619104.1 hypothetical protein [Chryseobacterium edaphi]
MYNFLHLLSDSLFAAEAIAAITSIVYYKSIKASHYRYFSIFLIVIFCCEIIGGYGEKIISFSNPIFFNYFVIPLEFLFFFWLYAYQSFKNKKLFYIFAVIYALSFILNELYFIKNKNIFSFNYTVGSFLLMFLVIIEYYKQINSDDILNFAKNKMFYINLGVTLFYIGSLPFWAFYLQLLEHRKIWDLYLIYFRLSGIIMYLLFASSFIWGKRNS